MQVVQRTKKYFTMVGENENTSRINVSEGSYSRENFFFKMDEPKGKTMYSYHKGVAYPMGERMQVIRA